MTGLSKTPELWRLLNVGEVVRMGDEVYTCDEDGANWDLVDEGFYLEPVLGDDAPVRRRLDPSLDPLTPLREQLTQGWAIMDRLYNLTSHILKKDERYPVRAWLGKNAAFGPGKGEA